jgi:Protein of unknown function (DUF1778)
LTEFLLDNGLNAALDILANHRVFQLDQKRWDAFMAALSAPPKNNAKLRKLLARKPLGKNNRPQRHGWSRAAQTRRPCSVMQRGGC